jgi:hypothetical protein
MLKKLNVADLVGKTVQMQGEAARYEVAAASDDRVTFFHKGGGFHQIMKTQTFLDTFTLVTESAKFEEVLITADWLDEGVSIPAYSDGSCWNGWAVPYFGEEGVQQLLSLLPNVRRGKGMHATLEVLETEPPEWIPVDPKVIVINDCAVLTFPVGAHYWCWDTSSKAKARALTVKSVFLHESPKQAEYHDINVYMVMSDSSEWRFQVSMDFETGAIYDGDICFSANKNAVFEDASNEPPPAVVDAYRAKRIEVVALLQRSYSLRNAWRTLIADDPEFMTAMLEELVERRITKSVVDLYWQFRALGESGVIVTDELIQKVSAVLSALTPPTTLIEVDGMVEATKVIADESVEIAFKEFLKTNP